MGGASSRGAAWPSPCTGGARSESWAKSRRAVICRVTERLVSYWCIFKIQHPPYRDMNERMLLLHQLTKKR